jgi:hypothetical protein
MSNMSLNNFPPQGRAPAGREEEEEEEEGGGEEGERLYSIVLNYYLY